MSESGSRALLPQPSQVDRGENLPWESAAITDVGRVRDHNEDVFLMRPDLGLFMVCDGMGGYSAGEVAASIAVETANEFFESCRRDPEGTWPFKVDNALGEEGSRLSVALRLANQRIRLAAQGDAGKHNMGTTAVAAFLEQGKTYVAHAGDSRAYLFREGDLKAVTADHSLLGEFIRNQHPSAEEIQAFPYKNVINRALGPSADVKVDSRPIDMRLGDTLLLCCDGLHGMISDETIAQILWTHPSLEEASRALVDSANAAGGSDNVTVVLVRRH
jgi:serine/threonine protein phosphatase PrpC